MIKQHNCQSLGKYMLTNVYNTRLNKIGKMTQMEEYFCWVRLEGEKVSARFLNVEILPLLKDYTQLLTPMMHEGVEILPIEWVYGIKYKYTKYEITQDGIVGCRNLHFMVSDLICNKEFKNHLQDDEYEQSNDFTIEVLQKLQVLGFGAIKCDESPTGWRDLWWNPCALDEGK